MNKDIVQKYVITWVGICLCCCFNILHALTAPPAVSHSSYSLQRDETQVLPIPDGKSHLLIQNQGIDTIASALDAQGNVIQQSATWRGREGRYVLDLSNASTVSIEPAERFSNLGNFTIQWVQTDSKGLDALATGAFHHLSNQAGSNGLSIIQYQKATEELTGGDYQEWIADAFYEMGHLYKSSGQLNDAYRSFALAVQAYQAQDNNRGIAATYNALAIVSQLQGKTDLAVEQFNTALVLRQTINDPFYTAQTNNNLAILYWGKGNYLKAIQAYEHALHLYQGNNQEYVTNLPQVANTLNNLALVKSSLGLVNEAEVLWHDALAIAQELGKRKRVARIQVNLGRLLQEQGRLEAALVYINAAIETFTELNSNAWLGTALNVIGNIYAALDQPTIALDYYHQALSLIGENQHQRAYTLEQTALVNWSLGHIDIAHQQFEEASTSYINSNQIIVAATASSKFGQFLFEQGQPEGIDKQRKAIDTLSRLGQVRETARAQARLGQSLIEANQPTEGISLLQTALQGHRAVSDDLHELDTLITLSYTQPKTAAIKTAQTATELALQIRSKFSSTSIQTGFFASQHAAFSQYIGLLIQDNQIEKAWLVNEQMRGRALLDSIQENDQSLVVFNQPIDIQSLQQSLLNDTTLLSYFLGDNGSHLWEVSHDSVVYHPLPAANQIDTIATTLTQVLRSERQSPSRIDYLAQQLSDLVLPKALNNLEQRKVVVVADGGLQLIPFGLLHSNEHLLLESSTVTYSPSAKIFAILSSQEQANIQDILVLADPLGSDSLQYDDRFMMPDINLAKLTAQRSLDQAAINISRLPGAQLEASSIKMLYDQTQVLTGTQASHNFVMSDALSQYDVVHFATHGVVDSNIAALSGLVLSSGSTDSIRYLRPQDITKLNLHADLVVLSGCETGIGQSVNGEGILSLSRSFLTAGAQQVVSTLWKVSDRPTAQLMEHFYYYLLRESQTPEQALASAQQWMREYSDWQHPYFWAAFVIQGGHKIG